MKIYKKVFILILILFFSIIVSIFCKDSLAYFQSSNSLRSNILVTDVISYTPEMCFEYTEEANNSITITGYKYDGVTCNSDISIPPKINGKNVKTIGYEAFAYLEGTGSSDYVHQHQYPITSLALPYGLEIIENNAFANPNNISMSVRSFPEIAIPNTVKTIGNFAFRNNKILELSLHEGLESIGNYAFYQNPISGILEIPSTVKSVGDFAFAMRDDGVLMKCNDDRSCNSINNIVLHEGIETIGKGAFANNKITSLEIPGTVKDIGSGPFAGATLSSITFNEGVEDIPADFFKYTRINGSLDLPGSIKIVKAGIFNINNSTDRFFHNITTLTLHEGIDAIEENAFYNNNNYVYINDNINFPSSLKSIGANAFKDIYRGASLEIPGGVKSISISAFENHRIATLKLHEGLESIEKLAFATDQTSSRFKHLSGILEIPSTVKTIEEKAFYNNQLTGLILYEGIETIASQSFEINSSGFIKNKIKKVDIPNSVSSLASDAFNTSVIINKK